jgi:Na+/H+ antiporter NhaC
MTLLIVIVVMAAAFGLTLLLPADVNDYGAASLIPAVFLIVYIFATQRIIEALTLASLIGFIMVSRPGAGEEGSWVGNIFTNFSEGILGVMMSEDIAWLIIVCGLMGSIIALIEKSGGAFAFGQWISKKAKTKKASLMWTWFLGVVIFIDDYLNSLTVGSCMTKLTDQHRVPREFLSYIVDSTAAPLCVIIPISTWAVFCSRILETNNWAPAGEGLRYFIKTIPFNFYGWIAAICVPLVILGIVPVFGPMKKAEMNAKGTQEIMNLITGLNVSTNASKGPTLMQIQDPKSVPHQQYLSIINEFARKYRALQRIKSKGYNFVFESNNIKYYWIPVEDLP